mmetsp:Transcript_19192/g.30659  ORF Transcript_19192/g.30659 Transcript_19192/m.30659 type:complete len:644 (+) Transcript_19192:87-2018(+)
MAKPRASGGSKGAQGKSLKKTLKPSGGRGKYLKNKPAKNKPKGGGKGGYKKQNAKKVAGKDAKGGKKDGKNPVAKGSGKGKEDSRVAKRKAAAPAEEEDDGKKGKFLTVKQKRRKEVTTLYSELINPGRTRKPDVIVAEVLVLLKERSGNLAEYCSKHMGARVVEACLKWGSRLQRRELLTTFKEHLPKMAQDRYGHQVVLKILLYSSRTSKERKPTEEEKKAQAQNMKEILGRFSGKNLHSTFYHRHGCKVINGIYHSDVVSAKEKRRILHDIAMPQAVALQSAEMPGSRPLRELLKSEEHSVQQRADIVAHLLEAAERCVDKELLGYELVHVLFQAVTELASETQLTELGEKCMDGAPYLLSSKAGAEAVLRLLGVASAKQRKAFCRDLKGKFSALTKNAVDYTVMMRLASTVDDTVMLVKGMIEEWKKDLEEICFDKYGHKVLAWLLRPDDKRIFSPYEQKCVGYPAPTSLKAAETRRQELVRAIRPPLRAVLLSKALEAAADLHAKDLLVAYLSADWDAELVEALVAAGEQEAKNADLGLLGNGTATTTLIVLLKLEPEKDGQLAQSLWKRCLQPQLTAAASSRCAFLLLALLKRGGPLGDTVKAALRTQRKAIEKAVAVAEAAGGQVNGAQKLLSELK